ncbi:CCA tRNA nucleotidyltransferase [Candidatus Omnitrophota bacterium]
MKIDIVKKTSGKVLSLVKILGRIADEEGARVYIVGGPVRDMLLGVSNYDLDFVVEADAIKFSEVLNKTLKGRLTVHKAFGTATIAYKDFRIDVVTARSESYEHPAAYPDVEPATIKEDLFRRDFTINAMAIIINKKGFGELIDFYGGLKDLKKGIVRVMHDKSFMDDPTRIFRAVRFSSRFNFKIESHTKKLMKEAVLAGFLGEVNRGRIKKEMELFLKEDDPLKYLRVFSRLIARFNH